VVRQTKSAIRRRTAIKKKENGGACPVDPKADNNALRKYMGEILPEYDKDRVYPSDMRKLFVWYNILITKGFDTFVASKEEEEAKEEVKS